MMTKEEAEKTIEKALNAELEGSAYEVEKKVREAEFTIALHMSHGKHNAEYRLDLEIDMKESQKSSNMATASLHSAMLGTHPLWISLNERYVVAVESIAASLAKG